MTHGNESTEAKRRRLQAEDEEAQALVDAMLKSGTFLAAGVETVAVVPPGEDVGPAPVLRCSGCGKRALLPPGSPAAGPNTVAVCPDCTRKGVRLRGKR